MENLLCKMILSLYALITLVAIPKTNYALLAWDHALKDLHNDLTCKWNLSHRHKPIESEVHEIFELIHKLTHNKKTSKNIHVHQFQVKKTLQLNNDIDKSNWLNYPKLNLATSLLQVHLIWCPPPRWIIRMMHIYLWLCVMWEAWETWRLISNVKNIGKGFVIFKQVRMTIWR
jgi:hypothetical protein